jgi:hypothetical protein
MRIDIKSLQEVLSMVASDPDATLLIEPKRTVLSISGEFAWTVAGADNIAKVLDRAVEKFYDQDTDEPIEPK